MNDPWLEFAIRIQSIAQAGLQYGKDPIDRERYQALRDIAAEMVAERTELPVDTVRGIFCNESGCRTPKVDTHAVVSRNGKIPLVRENNGTWSLPGAGAMWTSPWPTTPRRGSGKRRAAGSGRKGLLPFGTGGSIA